MERDEHGRDDGAYICSEYWSEGGAAGERDRLDAANTDENSYFVVMEDTATVVYPADELPPWVDDRDRLRKRGYEMPEEDS